MKIKKQIYIFFQYIPTTHAIIGAAFLIINIPYILFILLISNVIYFIIADRKSKLMVWFYAGCCLIMMNLPKKDNILDYLLNEVKISDYTLYQSVVISAWYMNKCISFAMDKIEAPESEKTDFTFINFLGYTLHFPTLFFGPIVIYDRYRVLLRNRESESLGLRTKQLVIDLGKCLLCIYFVEFILHYIYIYCLQNNSYVSINNN